jgi:heavy metal sensor kinase
MKRGKLFFSIRTRLTVWYVSLLALALSAFSASLYFILQEALYHNLDNVLMNHAEMIAANMRLEEDEWENTHNVRLHVRSDPQAGEHFWRLINEKGQIILQSGVQDIGNLPIDTEAIQTAMRGSASAQTVRISDDFIRLYTTRVTAPEKKSLYLQVGISEDEVRETLNDFLSILALTLPITLALTAVGGTVLSAHVLRPIDDITRAARAIGANDLSQRLNLHLPDDELGRLANTLDEMIERLDKAFLRQRRFTADASHELRTPLTIIKGNISLALARERDAHYYRTVLETLNRETDRLIRIVNRLLTLARLDADQLPLRPIEFDLGALTKEIVEQWRPIAEAKGLQILCSIPVGQQVRMDVDAFIEILSNLIENAIKYTTQGHVTVDASIDDSNLFIVVSDTGVGIAPEHLPHLFEPFYRVDRARSRGAEGVGLGLAIVDRLARAHGGEVRVTSMLGRGSAFTVRLPLRP